MRLHHLVVATLLAVSASAAEEGKISDLRLGFYGMGTEGTKDFELTNATTGAMIDSGTESDDLSSHGRFSINYVGGEAKPVGMIYGIGLAFDAAEYDWDDGSNFSQSWTGVIVDVNLGVAMMLNESIHVEAAGILGLGGGSVDFEGPGLDIDPASAVIVEWGLRAGAYLTLGALQAGLEVGWMSTNYLGAEWEVPALNRNYTEDVEAAGAFVGLTLGARL